MADEPTASKRKGSSKLAAQDVEAIRFAQQLKGGAKLATAHYGIGSSRVYAIWKSDDPMSFASLGRPNLPSWFPGAAAGALASGALASGALASGALASGAAACSTSAGSSSAAAPIAAPAAAPKKKSKSQKAALKGVAEQLTRMTLELSDSE